MLCFVFDNADAAGGERISVVCWIDVRSFWWDELVILRISRVCENCDGVAVDLVLIFPSVGESMAERRRRSEVFEVEEDKMEGVVEEERVPLSWVDEDSEMSISVRLMD